jgi:hypothetical protein
MGMDWTGIGSDDKFMVNPTMLSFEAQVVTDNFSHLLCKTLIQSFYSIHWIS